MIKTLFFLRQIKKEIIIAILIGTVVYLLSLFIKSVLYNPLIVALLFGIIWGMSIPNRKKKNVFVLLPFLLMPFASMFYAVQNINFYNLTLVNYRALFLIIIVFLSYLIVTILMGRILKQKKAVTYLVATGGAMCGASAIAVTAPAVDADADDVSIALLSVLLAAIFGSLVLMPFLAISFGFTNEIYAYLTGSVMQFEGFVELAIGTILNLKEILSNTDVIKLALSITAIRYIGLLVVLPVLYSLTKRKIILPWYFWTFALASIAGSFYYITYPGIYNNYLVVLVKPVYILLWSIAFIAIGYSTNVTKLFSHSGLKALIMSFVGMMSAIGVFILCMNFMNL